MPAIACLYFIVCSEFENAGVFAMDLFPVAVRGSPQLFRVAELRGGPSTSFGVFATLSLYRYSLLCTYCTNSRRRFDSAGGIALRTATAAAAKAAAGALWQPGGRAGPKV